MTSVAAAKRKIADAKARDLPFIMNQQISRRVKRWERYQVYRRCTTFEELEALRLVLMEGTQVRTWDRGDMIDDVARGYLKFTHPTAATSAPVAGSGAVAAPVAGGGGARPPARHQRR